jgi:hypothetical protein
MVRGREATNISWKERRSAFLWDGRRILSLEDAKWWKEVMCRCRNFLKTYRTSKGFEGLGKLGVVELVHGFAINIIASMNMLSLYSASVGKIWIMVAKLKDKQGTMKLKDEFWYELA